MRDLKRIGLAVALVLLTVGAATHGQQLATAAGDFYTRLEVMSRMLQIIQHSYVDDVEVDEIFDNAIAGVLDNLDPHSKYYTAEEYRELQEQYRGDYAGIGISFELFDGTITVLDALEGGPSEALGLRAGDQIVGINGEDATDTNVEEVYQRLRGPKGTEVDVTVRRPGLDELLAYTITRDTVDIAAVSVATMLTEDIGYLRLGTFSAKASDQIEQSLRDLEAQGMKRLIFDLRANGGGLMVPALQIADKFLSGGKTIVKTMGRTPNANSENVSTDHDTHPSVPMIVLVNRGSASASEIVAGALQDWDRALVVGETTFGKALVQNQFQFKDGSALLLTIARYYTPSGRLIQRPYEGKDAELYHNPELDEDYMESAEIDSLVPIEADEQDTLDTEDRPQFHTPSGRIVYGGGGIHPDVVIEPTRVSGLAAAFYRPTIRLYFRFAVDYTTRHAAELPVTFENFQRDFEVDDAMVQDFVDFVRRPEIRKPFDEAGVSLDDETVQKAWEDLRIYIRSDIAAVLWGQEKGREVLLDHDGQIDKAIDLFPQAANLLTRQKVAG